MTRIVIGSEVDVQIYNEPEYFDISIASAFSYEHGNERHMIDPSSRESTDFIPLIDLRDARVIGCSISNSGNLKLELEHDIRIAVGADATIEAWEIRTSQGQLIVATAGGGAAVWDRSAQAPDD